jgi:hypothetical protein
MTTAGDPRDTRPASRAARGALSMADRAHYRGWRSIDRDRSSPTLAQTSSLESVALRTVCRRSTTTRVPKYVPSSANLRSSESISGAEISLRKANLTAFRDTRNEGVRGSSPRVGLGFCRSVSRSRRHCRLDWRDTVGTRRQVRQSSRATCAETSGLQEVSHVQPLHFHVKPSSSTGLGCLSSKRS